MPHLSPPAANALHRKEIQAKKTRGSKSSWGALDCVLDTGEKGGKAVINGYILSYDARTTNPKTRTEGRRPEQLTNQSRTAIRVQGEGLSFVTKIQPTEVEGMTSLAPGLFDIAERVRSMFSHACA